MPVDQRALEEKVVEAVRRHLAGLRRKIETDFASASCEAELAALRGDEVYSLFAFDCEEYVLIRLMGRVSISIGRRLGEIYDKIPRFLAAGRYALDAEQVAERFDRLELDICLRLAELPRASDRAAIKDVVARHLPNLDLRNGPAIEIRYNFNPNDSARLRKDVELGRLVQQAGLLPIYLVFSGISPRAEAIARLTRAGWNFLVGANAIAFANDLLGLDLMRILTSPRVKAEVKQAVDEIMRAIVGSHAFRAVLAKH